MNTNFLGRHFQIRQRQEDDWKQPPDTQQGEIILLQSEFCDQVLGSMGEVGEMVICLDLNRTFDMVTLRCGIILDNWERDEVVRQATHLVSQMAKGESQQTNQREIDGMAYVIY